jgi:hypothetical protein
MNTVRQRQPRKKENGHLDYIRGLPCCVCGDNTSTEAAHIRMADARAGKRYVGKGEKADDRWTVPLCGPHHRHQHIVGEATFWKFYHSIKPILLALALHSVSGDHEAGCRIIEAHHEALTP